MLLVATCRAYPDAPAGLAALAEHLNRAGIPTDFEIWQNRPERAFLLPLCAWDYAAEPEAFAQWLVSARAAGCRFVNPPDLMRWNMDKRYLCDLAKRGANVIPSRFCPPDTDELAAVLREERWHEAVMKPVFGQSGRGVVRIRAGVRPDWSDYAQGVLVQPYVPEVAKVGETSLVFFDGRFSHAVLRMPKQGEWRANSAYGVEIRPLQPDSAVEAAAAAVLALLPDKPVYARVDGTKTADGFLINEVELIEPALYLETDASVVGRFAAVLAGHIRGGL